MMDSDSDDSDLFMLGEPARHDDGSGSENDEPPRRRMRMDPDVAAPAAAATMTLRSGRSVQAGGSVNAPPLPLPPAALPHTAATHQQLGMSMDNALQEQRQRIIDIMDSSSSSESDYVPLQGSSAVSFIPSAGSFWGSSPGSAVSGISIGSHLSSGPNTIDLDLDIDYQESVNSFESYDLDELSDVPVVRSPTATGTPNYSSSESSVDGESLFGRFSENEAEAGQDQDGTGEEEANPGTWQRRRLQRRNAIVLENTDSQDSAAENDQEEHLTVADLRRNLITPLRAALALAAEPKPATITSLPTTDEGAFPVSVPVDDDDNDGSTCIICCEPFTNSGEHRLCCLKCGHTYGKFCIEKWIKNESRCPQCNAKATKKDVRVIYAKNLRALDTAERDRLKMELDKEQEMKRKGELQNALLYQKLDEVNTNYKKLLEEHRCLKERVGTVYRDPALDHLKPSTSTSTGNNAPKSILSLQHSFPFKDGECRVGAYDDWLNMLAVSQTVKSALYPQGCFGIKKINLLDMRPTATTPIHQKEIRDLEFNSQGDVLLSVGFDKKAILTNCNTNVTVQCFNTEAPLWSCAWSKIGQHIFYAGTTTGQILAYDVRKPGEVLKTLVLPSDDKTPTARLKFISPGQDRKSGSGFFSMTGLLVQKLNSVWFCELRNEEFKFHQLPFEGTILSVDFEPKSRHALISTRASNKQGKIVPSRHIVADLTQYYSEVQQATVCTCNIVQSYEGNESQVGKLTRPSIFNTEKDNVLVAAEVGGLRFASATSVWDVAEPSPQQVLPGIDPVLDFVPCRVNNDLFLGSISANNLNIYKFA